MSGNREAYEYGALWSGTLTNDEFATMARRPDEWINAARPLRVAAYVVKAQCMLADFDRVQGRPAIRSTDLLFTALFLASLNLENVLKALLLVRRPETVNNGKLSFKNGHDLVALADEAGFKLDRVEADFLRLSCNPCIVSFGRYPMGRHKSDMPGLWQVHTSAFGIFERLFMRAAVLALEKTCKDANDHRAVELRRLSDDLRTDLPPALSAGY